MSKVHMDIEKITLLHGGHNSRCDASGQPTLCAMELVSWLCDEPHSDAPACVAPEIASYVRRLNDAMPDDQRQRLKPFLSRTMNTADDGKQVERMYLIADNAVRYIVPLALDAVGLKDEAQKLRNLSPVTSRETASAAYSAAHSAAYSAARSAALVGWDPALELLDKMLSV
jgi:hypothetical protein